MATYPNYRTDPGKSRENERAGFGTGGNGVGAVAHRTAGVTAAPYATMAPAPPAAPDGTASAVLAVDMDGWVVHCNDAARRIFGLAHDRPSRVDALFEPPVNAIG